MNKRDLCSIVQSHKRILEAHRLWHQAEKSYFDPEGFRTNINAAIQALRNVTFALQNEKSKIPNYETWYKQWVDVLKKDKIMSWLCDARTDIVHKKDLELNSIAIVSIQNYETILKANIKIPLFISGKSILLYLLESNIIDVELKNSEVFALIERRWVVDAFPEFDLLYVIGYGIGTLYTMIKEVHDCLHIDVDNCSVTDTMHVVDLDVDGYPICMKRKKSAMQEQVGLKDFLTRELTIHRIDHNPKRYKESIKRYRKTLGDSPLEMSDDPYSFGLSLFEHAKKVLAVDGYHYHFLYFQTADLKWDLVSPSFDDRTSKFMFWQKFANKVIEEQIISIIFLGESWLGSPEKLIEDGLYPADQPDRQDVLMVNIFTNDFNSKSYSVIFKKKHFGKIEFAETIIEEDILSQTGYIQPILKVWKEKSFKSPKNDTVKPN